MKVSGIDYGLGSPWEIEVPDSAMVIEGPNPDRIPRALENPAQAVRDAIRKPMGMKPLAELVTASSKVTIAARIFSRGRPGRAMSCLSRRRMVGRLAANCARWAYLSASRTAAKPG